MKTEDERDTYWAERQRMVDEQIESRDVRDARVLEAMRTIPRHLFIPPEYHHLSYTDGPLPIGCGQTISQPYIVAYMTQLLQLSGEEKALEVGTGSGYQAAILGYLTHEVHTIERHADLAAQAAEIIELIEITNVHVHVGDGSLGLPEQAPFQAIIVTAAAPDVPKALLEQLSEGGRLVIPVGGQWGQYLERWQRKGPSFTHEVLAPVAFVPLRGKSGWKEDKWQSYDLL